MSGLLKGLGFHATCSQYKVIIFLALLIEVVGVEKILGLDFHHIIVHCIFVVSSFGFMDDSPFAINQYSLKHLCGGHSCFVSHLNHLACIPTLGVQIPMMYTTYCPPYCIKF